MSNNEWIAKVSQSSDRVSIRCPYRELVVEGDSLNDAVGQALKLYCELGARGSINPEHPDRPGGNVIQHVMSVLSKAMESAIELRRGCGPVVDSDGNITNPHAAVFSQRNQEISGLATALAAVARVNVM
jgi:hypothetical protein